MRCITITYKYAGDEAAWNNVTSGFINAVESDPKAAGKFTYQVAVADDGETRIHWGRWDSAQTLTHVQSQDYFKTFATAVRNFAGGAPVATGADVVSKSPDW